MTYTRQHFEHVAKILKQFQDEIPQTTFEEIVMEFGDLFLAYNENFSDIRFQEACGINWRTFVRLQSDKSDSPRAACDEGHKRKCNADTACRPVFVRPPLQTESIDRN